VVLAANTLPTSSDYVIPRSYILGGNHLGLNFVAFCIFHNVEGAKQACLTASIEDTLVLDVLLTNVYVCFDFSLPLIFIGRKSVDG